MDDEERKVGYRGLLAKLARRISDGYYERDGRGGWLPSQAKLAAEHKISTTSLRIVLAILQDRGLIRGHRGKGYYVVGSQADPERERADDDRPEQGRPDGHAGT